MTHVQSIWKAVEVYQRHPEIRQEDVKELGNWSRIHIDKIPEDLGEEQLILFLHACYNDMENAKKCMLAFYSIRRKAKQLFRDRDIFRPELQNALEVLNYGIVKQPTPQGYRIIFHNLRNNNPSLYNFNYGFKLLAMAVESLYAKKGPIEGCVFLFDLKGVKFGHVARLPINSIKKAMDFIQDGSPMRLKTIHVINCHPIIDKIMFIAKPLIRDYLLELLHFHKEGDESVLEYIPRECMPSDYFDGTAPSVAELHEEFVAEMKNLHPLFVTEDNHLEATFYNRAAGKKRDGLDEGLSKLEID